jgi:non-ribosomal peptide synthetase component F
MIRICPLDRLCVHELVSQQAEKSPEAIALTFQDQSLTYRELDQQANQLARYLQTLGVGAETLVGVCVDRSIAMLVTLLAILKAGGAYIPIDPSYPADRVAFMIEDSQLAVLVTQTTLRDQLPTGNATIVDLTQDAAAIAQQSTQDLGAIATPDNLAYIIYTSGSTGQPKGVQIIHRAVVNFLESMQVAPGIDSQDVLLAITTISFDIAVLELFARRRGGCAATGAVICAIAADDHAGDARDLADAAGGELGRSSPAQNPQWR